MDWTGDVVIATMIFIWARSGVRSKSIHLIIDPFSYSFFQANLLWPFNLFRGNLWIITSPPLKTVSWFVRAIMTFFGTKNTSHFLRSNCIYLFRAFVLTNLTLRSCNVNTICSIVIESVRHYKTLMRGQTTRIYQFRGSALLICMACRLPSSRIFIFIWSSPIQLKCVSSSLSRHLKRGQKVCTSFFL